MKSPEKLRCSEFAASELPSELMVRPFDATLTEELPETMVNSSPPLSPMMVRLVVVDCRTLDRNGCTVTTGTAGLAGPPTGGTGTTETTRTTGATETTGRTLAKTSGVTTVCTDTTGSTETIGVTTARTRTSGAGGASGAGSGAALGAAAGAAFGAADGCGAFAGAGTGAGAAGDCADSCGGSAGGSVVWGGACCDTSEWTLMIVGRNAAMRHTTGIAQSM